jgi:hypothetical protein
VTATRKLLQEGGRNLGAASYCVRRQPNGGLGVGDTMSCQPNEGIRFFGLTVTARID